MGRWSDGISALPKPADTREVSPSHSPDKGKGKYVSHEVISDVYRPREKISK